MNWDLIITLMWGAYGANSPMGITTLEAIPYRSFEACHAAAVEMQNHYRALANVEPAQPLRIGTYCLAYGTGSTPKSVPAPGAPQGGRP